MSAPAAISAPADGFLEGKRVTIAMIAYLVETYPGRTSAELAQISEKERHVFARRLPEAERSAKHNVFRGAARNCQVTGNKALTWWPKAIQG